MNESQDLAIFTDAQRLSEPERVRYLDGACAGDVELRQRVEKLLRAFESWSTPCGGWSR